MVKKMCVKVWAGRKCEEKPVDNKFFISFISFLTTPDSTTIWLSFFNEKKSLKLICTSNTNSCGRQGYSNSFTFSSRPSFPPLFFYLPLSYFFRKLRGSLCVAFEELGETNVRKWMKGWLKLKESKWNVLWPLSGWMCCLVCLSHE
jgi:hypothetical protein